MAVTAKVICDSISPEGVRLTTLHLRYPRMIHSEFMTHRVFSRNGRSSRAVPFATLVKEEPYVPDFAYNQKGMVAGEKLTPEDKALAEKTWLHAVATCQDAALYLSKIGGVGVHKQWVNRMLEWFGYIDVLVSSTDWANWHELRDEVGAQPEIDQLAKAIKVAMAESTPRDLEAGQWHLPYIEIEDIENVCYNHLGYKSISDDFEQRETIEVLKKISVARCARLTIKPFDGDGSIEKELKRYELLMVSRPVHASPAEHIATPDTLHTVTGGKYDKWARRVVGFTNKVWDNPEQHGNFYGWRQFRKMIPHNTIYDR